MRVSAAMRLGIVLFLVACGDGTSPGTQLRVEPSEINMLVNSTAQIQVTDATATPLDAAQVTFSSQDPRVARVSETALVTGVGVGGTTVTVSLRAGGAKAVIIPVAVAAFDLRLGELRREAP